MFRHVPESSGMFPVPGFIYARMETLYIGGQKLSTDMAAGNQQKHLEFTFSIKTLPFHSRASIRAHKLIF